MLLSKNNIQINLKIVYLNNLYNIESFNFINPGKGQSFVRIKLRNILTTSLVVKNFKNFNSLQIANVIRDKYIFLYHTGLNWYFLHKKTLDLIILNKIVINNKYKFLVKDYEYQIVLWNNRPIELIIDHYIYIKVIKLSNKIIHKKQQLAQLVSGYYIWVPLFVKLGDLIKINTWNDHYISRK